MRVTVVGAGLCGLFSALALARRGHEVAVVDRDAGPAADGSWDRAGVMQFHQPHVFRAPVHDALATELPDVLERAFRAGVEVIGVPEAPGLVVGLRSRRQLLEAVLRQAVTETDTISLFSGHADAVCSEQGRAVGVLVNGKRLEADLVVDASGRASRFSDGLRAAAESSDSGLAYVSRRYRLLPRADAGPMNMPFGYVDGQPGYESLVFPEDNGFFTTLVLRGVDDSELAELRTVTAFEAAMRVLPGSREWTAPDRSVAVGPVRPGAGLYNSYRGQLDASAQLPLHGLVALGDTVCTTNPAAARGVTTSLLQARRFLELLDDAPLDISACVVALDDWCRDQVRPWVVDQVHIDADRVRHWAGEDVDLDRPLSSEAICAVAGQDPDIDNVARAYYAMDVLPSALAAVEPRARAVYASGWRQPDTGAPSRADLVMAIRQAVDV